MLCELSMIIYFDRLLLSALSFLNRQAIHNLYFTTQNTFYIRLIAISQRTVNKQIVYSCFLMINI